MKIRFENKDGLKLVGLLTNPRKGTKTCIILCHGATVNKEEGGVFTELANRLTKAGFSTFRFDFRGHGESEGHSIDMTIGGQRRDLEAVLQLLSKRGYRRFGMVSASFSGGAVSLFTLPHQDRIRALIYWNSVIDYRYLLKRWLSGGEKEKLRKKGFVVRGKSKYGKQLFRELAKIRLESKLRELKIPVLFIHGDKDSRIPYKKQIKLAKMLGAHTETVYGSEHGFHTKRHSKRAVALATAFFLEKLAK